MRSSSPKIKSTTGSQMTWLALPGFVLTTTGSPTRMTFVLAAEVIGLGIAGLPSLTLAANRMTLLLGAPLAGVPIGVLGAAPVLVIDAATYAVSFLIVLVFVPGRPGAPAEDESRGLLAGLRFLAHEPLLRVWGPLFILGAATQTLAMAGVAAVSLRERGREAREPAPA